MNDHTEMARLRDELDDALAVVDYLTAHQEPPLENLTDMESQIIRMLERAPGGYQPTERIIYSLNCHNPACTTSKGSVSSAVCRLRKKRPDIAARLQTVLRLGYRLERAA